LTLSRCVVPTLSEEKRQPFEGSVHMAFQSRGPRKLSASSTLKAIEQHLLEVGFSTTTLLFKGNYGSDYDR